MARCLLTLLAAAGVLIGAFASGAAASLSSHSRSIAAIAYSSDGTGSLHMASHARSSDLELSPTRGVRLAATVGDASTADPASRFAAETVTTSERISGPLWTSTKTDSSAANALRHFNDHGSDFPGLNNSLEYVADAQRFLRSPPAETLTRVRANGDLVRYNPESNTFGVMDSTGAPRTYFKPDPAAHGYPSNLDYFNAQ